MPKVVDHDKQRETLLDASFRLLADEGYEAATLRRMAAAAGVSTGTLYHYFPDKPAILAAMFDLLTRRDLARVQSRLSADATVPMRIATLFGFMREHADYLRDLLRVALEVQRHTPETERLQQALRRYRTAIGETLAVDGTLVEMAFTFLLGTLTYRVLDPDGLDLHSAEQFVQAVWARLDPAQRPAT